MMETKPVFEIVEIVENGETYETYKNPYSVDKRLYILERQIAGLQKIIVEIWAKK